MTEEENKHEDPASGATDLGKFKNVDALVRAYRELEAEFTRRSQRLKALEGTRSDGDAPHAQPSEAARQPDGDGALYAAASQNEEVKRRIVGDYLASLGGVPLMAGGGAPVRAPARQIGSIGEASRLALGYLREQKS